MKKTKIPTVLKRDIVIRLNAQEAIDLIQQLGTHKSTLESLKQQLGDTQEERGEIPMTDTELRHIEDDLQFTCAFNSRVLKAYRQWQDCNDSAERVNGTRQWSEMPF